VTTIEFLPGECVSRGGRRGHGGGDDELRA
jgi:hypothetical protein